MADHNVSPDEHIQVRIVDRAEQMALYDSLPKAWRELIDALPVAQDLAEVVAVRAKFGEAGFQLIVDTYQQQYPGWTWEKGLGPAKGQGPSKA